MPADGFFKGADVAVACVEYVARCDTTVCRVEPCGFAEIDTGDLGMLKNVGTGSHRSPGDAERIVKRVQVARAHIERAGRVIPAADQRLHLIGRHISYLVVVVFFVEQLGESL